MVIFVQGFFWEYLGVLSCPIPKGNPESFCKCHVFLLFRMTGIDLAGDLLDMTI